MFHTEVRLCYCISAFSFQHPGQDDVPLDRTQRHRGRGGDGLHGAVPRPQEPQRLPGPQRDPLLRRERGVAR